MSDDVQEAMEDVFEAAARCGFLEEAQTVHREITRLRADVERLRSALRVCRDVTSNLSVYDAAREALGEDDDE